MFSDIATANRFVAAYGGWFRESFECVVVLNLQKSNFGNYFELNLKVFIQGLFNRRHARSKKMVKSEPGNVFLRPPARFSPAFDLDEPLTNDDRIRAVEALFVEFVRPITDEALTRQGLISLAGRGLVYLLPAVRDELGVS